MKILVIYAHPEATFKGFSFEFLKKAEEFFVSKKLDFEVLDLYKMNYDPVLKSNELYTAGNREISSQNLEIQQKIKEANGLIFIYPVWWGGMPAIMKGFMDRIFTPGFAFKYRKEKFLNFIPDKLLNDKKIVVFASLGGPWFVYKFILDPIKIVNKLIVFGMFCKKARTYQIYGATRINEKKIKEIGKITEKALKWLIK